MAVRYRDPSTGVMRGLNGAWDLPATTTPYSSVPATTAPSGQKMGIVGAAQQILNAQKSGNAGAFGMPGEDAFYRARMGEARRSIYSSLPRARSQILDVLEGRGLGQSSSVGSAMTDLYAGYGQREAQALSDIQAQQIQAMQQRYLEYLRYKYQKDLQKDASGGLFGNLAKIGGAVGSMIGMGGGGGGGGEQLGYYDLYPGTGGD